MLASKSKRYSTAKACAPCRRAKVKCAAERPCPRCVKRGRSYECRLPLVGEFDAIQRARRQQHRRKRHTKRTENNAVHQGVVVASIAVGPSLSGPTTVAAGPGAAASGSVGIPYPSPQMIVLQHQQPHQQQQQQQQQQRHVRYAEPHRQNIAAGSVGGSTSGHRAYGIKSEQQNLIFPYSQHSPTATSIPATAVDVSVSVSAPVPVPMPMSVPGRHPGPGSVQSQSSGPGYRPMMMSGPASDSHHSMNNIGADTTSESDMIIGAPTGAFHYHHTANNVRLSSQFSQPPPQFQLAYTPGTGTGVQPTQLPSSTSPQRYPMQRRKNHFPVPTALPTAPSVSRPSSASTSTSASTSPSDDLIVHNRYDATIDTEHVPNVMRHDSCNDASASNNNRTSSIKQLFFRHQTIPKQIFWRNRAWTTIRFYAKDFMDLVSAAGIALAKRQQQVHGSAIVKPSYFFTNLNAFMLDPDSWEPIAHEMKQQRALKDPMLSLVQRRQIELDLIKPTLNKLPICLFESSMYPTWFTDDVWMNDAMRTLMGYSRSECPGNCIDTKKFLGAISPPATLKATANNIAYMIAQGKSRASFYRVIKAKHDRIVAGLTVIHIRRGRLQRPVTSDSESAATSLGIAHSAATHRTHSMEKDTTDPYWISSYFSPLPVQPKNMQEWIRQCIIQQPGDVLTRPVTEVGWTAPSAQYPGIMHQLIVEAAASQYHNHGSDSVAAGAGAGAGFTIHRTATVTTRPSSHRSQSDHSRSSYDSHNALPPQPRT
jgi:Fungal Zn(2)-Cys(6) binuclear cluster domain